MLSSLEFNNNPFKAEGGCPTLNRFTISAQLERSLGPVTWSANLAHQGGVLRTCGNSEVTGLIIYDYDDYLLTSEASISLSERTNSYLTIGVDRVTGKADSGRMPMRRFSAFDNLYYSSHEFRGQMDLFVTSNPQGLLDLYLSGAHDLTSDWSMTGAIHYFNTVEDYVAFNGIRDKHLGLELDFGVTTTSIAGIRIENGLGFFLPSRGFAGVSDLVTGIWAYSSGIIDF